MGSPAPAHHVSPTCAFVLIRFSFFFHSTFLSLSLDGARRRRDSFFFIDLCFIRVAQLRKLFVKVKQENNVLKEENKVIKDLADRFYDGLPLLGRRAIATSPPAVKEKHGLAKMTLKN